MYDMYVVMHGSLGVMYVIVGVMYDPGVIYMYGSMGVICVCYIHIWGSGLCMG